MATYQATSYAINNSFAYDPAVSGAITSLSFSADRELNFNGTPLSVAGVSSIMEQGGNIYRFIAPITTEQGVFQTDRQSTVLPINYNLITNLSTGASDSSSHPNFGGTVLLFSVSSGVSSSLSTPFTGQVFTDNLSYAINPTSAVPLPDSLWLFGSGLSGMGYLFRRKNRQGSA